MPDFPFLCRKPLLVIGAWAAPLKEPTELDRLEFLEINILFWFTLLGLLLCFKSELLLLEVGGRHVELTVVPKVTFDNDGGLGFGLLKLVAFSDENIVP